MTTALKKTVRLRSRVRGKLRRLGALTSRIERLEADLEESLRAVRAEQEPRLRRLRRRKTRLAERLEQFCRSRREELLPEGRKSLATSFGRVGFRKGIPKVELLDETEPEEVCRRLRERGLAELVRVREAPDKRAVRRATSEGRLSEQALRACGLRLARGRERFHYRLSERGNAAEGEGGSGA